MNIQPEDASYKNSLRQNQCYPERIHKGIIFVFTILVNFPSAIAQAMEFERGEVVEWIIEDKHKMTLKRNESVLSSDKKKPQTDL